MGTIRKWWRPQNEKQKELFEETRFDIRTALLTFKDGVSVGSVANVLKDFIGTDIPYRELGFNSINEMFFHMDDIFEVRMYHEHLCQNNYALKSKKFIFLKQSAINGNSSHLRDMVSHQASSFARRGEPKPSYANTKRVDSQLLLPRGASMLERARQSSPPRQLPPIYGNRYPVNAPAPVAPAPVYFPDYQATRPNYGNPPPLLLVSGFPNSAQPPIPLMSVLVPGVQRVSIHERPVVNVPQIQRVLRTTVVANNSIQRGSVEMTARNHPEPQRATSEVPLPTFQLPQQQSSAELTTAIHIPLQELQELQVTTASRPALQPSTVELTTPPNDPEPEANAVESTATVNQEPQEGDGEVEQENPSPSTNEGNEVAMHSVPPEGSHFVDPIRPIKFEKIELGQENFRITQANSGVDFMVMSMKESNVKALMDLTDQMTGWYNFQIRKGDTTVCPLVETKLDKGLYAGYDADTKKWYRVQIVLSEDPEAEKAKAFFCDYGWYKDIRLADLRYLKEMYCQLPRQAFFAQGAFYEPDSRQYTLYDVMERYLMKSVGKTVKCTIRKILTTESIVPLLTLEFDEDVNETTLTGGQ